MTTSVTVRVPAKINLHLGVGAPRGDGYHPLTTVFQAIGLYDELRVTAADDWRLEVHVADYIDATAIPDPADNLVQRAAAVLEVHHRRSVPGHARVDKTIPVAGGLAGGSGNAAAALVALDRLWDLGTPEAELRLMAAELGSDVPFALLGGTALGTGRGDLVQAIADRGRWSWVAVPCREGLSTPEVYRHFDAICPNAPADPGPADELLGALESCDPQRLAAALHNDLQRPVLDLRPDLDLLIAEGERAGALRGLVSGSGPTCVFLCESTEAARSVADSFQAAGRVALVATGPVPGARVVDAG